MTRNRSAIAPSVGSRRKRLRPTLRGAATAGPLGLALAALLVGGCRAPAPGAPDTATPPDPPTADAAGASDDVRATPRALPDGSTGGAPDADADGVPDADDRCAGTPATRPVGADGCDLLDGAGDGVTFDPGSDTLTEEAMSVLADIASALDGYPLVTVSVAAHTDNRGPAEDNLELSRRRVLAVARRLVAEGVTPSRLKLKAYGESRPRVSNATAEGRASNRRIEFEIVE